jgi:hypothetical protein
MIDSRLIARSVVMVVTGSMLLHGYAKKQLKERRAKRERICQISKSFKNAPAAEDVKFRNVSLSITVKPERVH